MDVRRSMSEFLSRCGHVLGLRRAYRLRDTTGPAQLAMTNDIIPKRVTDDEERKAEALSGLVDQPMMDCV
jgi:hypothetical protein